MTTNGMDQETLRLTLEAMRSFASERLSDAVLLDFDAKDEFPEEVVRAIGSDELGLQLVFIPEELGGMGGGAFDVYRVCEAMARVDLGLSTGVLATFLGSDPIAYGGTTEQKEHWLGRIAQEGLLFAYGATEPQAGSDLGALRSKAERVIENGEIAGYKITGSKQWISNGGFADVYTVLANAPDGPTWFIVEKGLAGLSHGKPEDKHGIRASNTTTVQLDDVYVDSDHLVGGQEGRGLHQAQLVFGFTRLMVAAFGLGAGWEALDRAIPYSVQRKQAGGPLSEKQGYTHKLIVPHVVALEASRAFIEETAERLDANEGNLNTEGAIAKYLATEAGNRAADAAVQAHGGNGYAKEYMVEKIRRDIRITTIYEGTSEIMEMTICRDRWQEHLKSRGAYYHDQAKELERLEANHPGSGAETAALACHGLAEVLEHCRLHRLTRNQHIQLRLGQLIAEVEGTGALARRAARAHDQELNEKADRRFSASALSAISRIHAREAAQQVLNEGLRWIFASSGITDKEMTSFEEAIRLPDLRQAQSGLIEDMGYVADVLYDRI